MELAILIMIVFLMSIFFISIYVERKINAKKEKPSVRTFKDIREEKKAQNIRMLILIERLRNEEMESHDSVERDKLLLKYGDNPFVDEVRIVSKEDVRLLGYLVKKYLRDNTLNTSNDKISTGIKK